MADDIGQQIDEARRLAADTKDRVLADRVPRLIVAFEVELAELRQRAEQDSAALARVRALHNEFMIYEPCGHDHDDDDDDDVVDLDDLGLVCRAGYQYSICRECCTSGDEQTEECASGHTPGSCWPCATLRALDVPADGEQPGGGHG